VIERAAPPWLHNAAAAAWREATDYARTTGVLARAPYRFAQEWWTGARAAMNPLAMLATGATLVTGARQLALAVLGVQRPDSVIALVLSALGPYVHYVVFGLIFHAILRPGAPQRARLGDSVAISLFAGAGPAALAEAAGWLAIALVPALRSGGAIGVILGVAFSVFCYAFASAMAGLHGVRWWRLAIAILIAFPLTGVAFGLLEPPGNYGLHWVIQVDRDPLLSLGW
jgi:hypothetical protein